MARINAWLILGAVFMPLFFFAMEEEIQEEKSDVVISLKELDQEGDAENKGGKKNELIESDEERDEREKHEKESPYIAFKKDAKNVVAFMWSVPEFKTAAEESLTEVELLEYMKVASAFSEEDEGKSFKQFMDAVHNEKISKNEKVALGATWLARMVQYRHHKSEKHKQKKKEFAHQKVVANQRTVGVTIAGGLVTLMTVLLQHYFPSGCPSVPPVIVNKTIEIVGSFI